MPRTIRERAKKFWNFNQVDALTTEVLIYDYIAMQKSMDFWSGEQGTEVTPTAFRDEMQAVTTPNICVRINSGGGDVAAAVNLAVIIKDTIDAGKEITCKIDGYCASAAVQVALACKSVAIAESGYMMVHNPMQILIGYYNAQGLTKIAADLTVIRDGILASYVGRTGLDEKAIVEMMDAETWMTGKQAVEKGFADEVMHSAVTVETVVEDEGAQNHYINGAPFQFAAYKHIPKALNDAFNKNITGKGAKEMKIENSTELREAFPDFVNEIVVAETAKIAENAVKIERERIQAIDRMSGTVDAEVLNKAKFETGATAESVALDAIQTGAFVNKSVIASMKNETSGADEVAGHANNGVDGSDEPEATAQAQKAAEIAKNHIAKNKKK